MAETIIIEEEVVEERTITVTELAQKALHLSLGAVALAQAEAAGLFEKAQKGLNERVENAQKNANEFYSKAVERGAAVETDGRERVTGFVGARKDQAKEVQGDLEGRIEKVLHRLNIPTKGDIEKLEKKLNTLTRKVNELSKSLPTAE